MRVEDRLIILKSVKFGESDLIIHGLSVTGERVNLIAKGALRSRKRFGGGVLEPTHFINASYRKKEGRPETLGFLEEASIIEAFIDLRSDYDRLELGLYMVQTVSKVVNEGDIHSREVFNLLGHSLRAACKSQNLHALRTHFEAKLLHSQGVLPMDIPFLNCFARPLPEHEHLAIAATDFSLVRRRVHQALCQYLEQ